MAGLGAACPWCTWCRQGWERPCPKWPSGANTPHREHNQTALEHTPHTPDIRQRDGNWLYPTPWIPVCVARVVWRAKAIRPRARRGARTPPGTWAGRPGRGPGGVDTLVIRLCGLGEMRPDFPDQRRPRSHPKGPGPPCTDGCRGLLSRVKGILSLAL